MTTTTCWHDPVVAEIHATRERLAEHYHDDLRAYSAAAEAHCRALGLIMAETRQDAVPNNCGITDKMAGLSESAIG